jgi:hypothetical protein
MKPLLIYYIRTIIFFSPRLPPSIVRDILGKTRLKMEEKEAIEAVPRSLGGDYVFVDKADVVPKRGVLFVEARIRDDVITDPQLQVVVSKVRIVLLLLYPINIDLWSSCRRIWKSSCLRQITLSSCWRMFW